MRDLLPLMMTAESFGGLVAGGATRSFTEAGGDSTNTAADLEPAKNARSGTAGAVGAGGTDGAASAWRGADGTVD